jgi:hypothetical protein
MFSIQPVCPKNNFSSLKINQNKKLIAQPIPYLFIFTLPFNKHSFMTRFINIVIITLLLGSTIYAQQPSSVAGSRKKQVSDQLDYRFRGGVYTFEKLFNSIVTYPDYARKNCIQGIIIASFDVTCDGQLGFVTIKNPLHYGIDDEVKKFFISTNGKWNKCHDKKYEHFEIPIQFRLAGTESITDEGIFTFEGKNPGYICNGEAYYLEKAKKYLDKGKGKKAINYLDILIRLDPYNSEYFNMKKQAISMGKSSKKKKK